MSQRFSPTKLRSHREHARLTRTALAFACKRTESVYLWEKGRVTPSTRVVGLLADALEIDVADLFEEQGR